MIYLENFRIFVEAQSNKPNIQRIPVTIDSQEIIILKGRDAESNDHLTFEIADPQDYWFHAKGMPGSHVVIKCGDKIPDGDLIYKAATIAAKSSSAVKKGLKQVDVIYCRKEFVSKKHGMNAGQVAVDEANANIIKVEI